MESNLKSSKELNIDMYERKKIWNIAHRRATTRLKNKYAKLLREFTEEEFKRLFSTKEYLEILKNG